MTFAPQAAAAKAAPSRVSSRYIHNVCKLLATDNSLLLNDKGRGFDQGTKDGNEWTNAQDEDEDESFVVGCNNTNSMNKTRNVDDYEIQSQWLNDLSVLWRASKEGKGVVVVGCTRRRRAAAEIVILYFSQDWLNGDYLRKGGSSGCGWGWVLRPPRGNCNIVERGPGIMRD